MVTHKVPARRVALVCVALALSATACGEDPVEVSSGGSPETTAGPSTTGGPTTTAVATTTAPPTTEPTATTEAPTSTTVVGATPEEAIAEFMAYVGLDYAGDCDDTDLDTDIGKDCTSLREDRGDERIYESGPTFSQYNTWLLLRLGEDGWAVADTAPARDAQPHPW